MHLIEPILAFDDRDYSLQTVPRASAGGRPGPDSFTSGAQLAETAADRNTHLWEK